MQQMDFKKYWQAFLQWKGWKAFASFCAGAWRCTVRWRGWKTLFALPFPVVVLLSAVCGGGLVWVFATGREASLAAYVIYPLSAYSVTALCVKLPSGIRGIRAWLDRHPKLSAALGNHELKFTLELYLKQFINFAYGVFKIASGAIIGSAWIGADGIYNFAQALIQLFQILRRKKDGSLVQQWKSYRFCGVLMLLMHLTLTGIVFQMVNWGRVEEHGEIMIIATAAFAFYKITTSFVSIAKDRKHVRPIDSSVRMLELSQAIFSMFSLQAGLLHTFGTGESWEGMLNLATGSMVCLLVAAMGVYMICRGNREIKTLQETENG